MEGNTPAPEERPVQWPPPLANRATRRACQHQVKAGYCAHCGMKVVEGWGC